MANPTDQHPKAKRLEKRVTIKDATHERIAECAKALDMNTTALVDYILNDWLDGSRTVKKTVPKVVAAKAVPQAPAKSEGDPAKVAEADKEFGIVDWTPSPDELHAGEKV